MTDIESLKEIVQVLEEDINKAIKNLISFRNELQSLYDKAALEKLISVSGPLYIPHMFANEPVTEVVVIGISNPEFDVDDKPYSYGVVDVKAKDFESIDDWLSVNANRIHTKTSDGKYVPVITEEFT